MKLKFTGKNHHQGDTQFFEISELPKGLKKTEKQFIAASERSGSFHALFGQYDMYQVEDGFIVDVKEDCILNHSLNEHLKDISMEDVRVLPKKDHRHTELKPGIYYVGIQNRFDPLAGMKTRVRD
jgi:hypothetical protein